MCLCWEEARIFVIFSEGTLNHWGRKGSILCFFIRTQKSWNADKSRCSELAQPTKTSRSLWFASWERLTYKVPMEEGGDFSCRKACVITGWRAPCRARSLPCRATAATSPTLEDFMEHGLPVHPCGASCVLLGKMPTVKMWERRLLIFLLCICVTSCVFLLGFPGTEKWAHSRKWFADGCFADWFINTHRHLYSSMDAKIILGKHSGFSFPRHFYLANHKKHGGKIRKYKTIGKNPTA